MFDRAVAAAQPKAVMLPFMPDPPKGRVVVVGAGKASAAMAAAFEDNWNGPLSGLVVTRYGHGAATRHIEIVEAAHPVPDKAGEQAARRILDLADGLGADDLLVVLISGGGSALLALPAAGLGLADKQEANRLLLEILEPEIEGTVDEASRIEGRVVVAEGAVVTRSIIRGPAIIGPGTEVTDSYIGPFTSVDADCAVVDSELEHSIVLARSTISNVPRITDSLIGRDAVVSRSGERPAANRFLVGDHCQITITP